MEISRKQLEGLHASMLEVLDNSNQQKSLTTRNIRTTNIVIMIFILLGVTLSVSIFYQFFGLTRAINHSIESMTTIQKQIGDLRHTMDEVTGSVKSMGHNVEVLSDMNESVGHMAQETGIINSYIAKLNGQTKLLSVDVSYVRYHVNHMNQRFSSINHAMNGVSFSLHETAKPVRQFIPLP